MKFKIGPTDTVSQSHVATGGTLTHFSPDSTVGASSSNVQITYPGSWPYQYPSYYYPVPTMHPHACPVCNGRETVKAGFYRDVSEEKGPQKCRGCNGRGLIYLP